MTLEELAGMLEKTGFPFAYDHFAEGESPDPPFICYLLPGSDNFSADGRVSFRTGRIPGQKPWWKQFWMMPGFFIISRRSGSRAKSCMRCCTVWNCNDLLNDGGIICLIRITR